MPSSSEPDNALLRQFLDLLVSVRERPHHYCRTIGELHDFIAQLYEICASADGKEQIFVRSLNDRLASRGLSSIEHLLAEQERGHWFGEDDEIAGKVIAFWNELDEALGFPSPRGSR
jgi:hypothetical protein